MYTTPEEDRSDLYLAGAVYFIGPVILGILLQGVSLPPLLSRILDVVILVATTILVPFLLIRYRKERVNDYGLAGSRAAFLPGFVAALPLAAATVLGNLIAGVPVHLGIPLIDAFTLGAVYQLLFQVVAGVCVVLLAIYATTKARTAFRADPRYIRGAMVQPARVVGIAGVVAALLLFGNRLTEGAPVTAALLYLVIPIGVAGTVWLTYRAASGSQLTTRPTLITPMVILGGASLSLFSGALAFVVTLWVATMLAAVGLAIGALLESHRSAWAPLGLGVGMALLTTLLR